ncbi:MAG: hypothetical protein ACI35Q_09655 [Marinilabiliaceae bacterium]
MTSDDNNEAEFSSSANGRLANAVQNAVKRLIGRSIELKSRVVQLEKENKALRDALAGKDDEICSLKQQLESCKLGLALRDSSSEAAGFTREEAKRRIGRMVREIDECIALLKQ